MGSGVEGGTANAKKKTVPAEDWQERTGDEILKRIMMREGNRKHAVRPGVIEQMS